jgi:hypothetical protein
MKPFHEMTIDELQVELDRWNKAISEAKQWGAALAAADSFRKQITRELARRQKDSTL